MSYSQVGKAMGFDPMSVVSSPARTIPKFSFGNIRFLILGSLCYFVFINIVLVIMYSVLTNIPRPTIHSNVLLHSLIGKA